MYVGFALFRFKKGEEKFALKHMKKHLKLIKDVKGFIHGYVAKSVEIGHEYLVIEEYETSEAQAEAQKRVAKDATHKPSEYIKFNKIMKEKPRIEVFKKKEVSHGKLTSVQKKVLDVVKNKIKGAITIKRKSKKKVVRKKAVKKKIAKKKK
jgi:heme-degrading monooxygenase HmoA